MPMRVEPKLSDEELDRRARELFAEVRGEHSEERAGRALESAADAVDEVGSDMFNWLFDTGSGDDGGKDHSD